VVSYTKLMHTPAEKTNARAPVYCAFINHCIFRKEILGTENMFRLNNNNNNNNNNSLILVFNR